MNLHQTRFSWSVATLGYSLLLSGLILAATLAHAQGDTDSFLRFEEGQSPWQGRLQTAITRYGNSEGIEIELVAAIHIADPGYYSRLNEYFATRQLVLYELVADPDQRPYPSSSSRSTSLIGSIQQLASRLLGLEFQLQHIDYTAANFRHADLSPAQLQEIMEAKNETFFSMLMTLTMAQMAAEKEARARGEATTSLLNGGSLLRALSAEDSGRAIKYLLGRELARGGGQLLPPELEEQITILADRNEVAISVLAQALNDAELSSISVFYGAAHMPGLARELTEKMGFRRLGQRWLDAWVVE